MTHFFIVQNINDMKKKMYCHKRREKKNVDCHKSGISRGIV